MNSLTVIVTLERGHHRYLKLDYNPETWRAAAHDILQLVELEEQRREAERNTP